MKLLKFFRNNWIAVWLIIAVCSLTSVISYAAYTGTTTAKRVISLSKRDSILFSSRYMSMSGTDMQPILFNYTSGETPSTPFIMVDVCNYDVNSNVYGSNFSYKIKARLVHNDGSQIYSSEWAAISHPTTYKISYQSVSSGTLTEQYKSSLSTNALTLNNDFQYLSSGQEYQFKGSDKTRYLFKAEFDINDIINENSAYGIEIVAEVVGQHSNLGNISGKLRVIKGGTSTASTWFGKFMDDSSNNKKPADYDGINYQISGNAVGTVKLKYRCDCVEIDKDSLSALSPIAQVFSTEEITVNNILSTVYYNTLTISVDPNTQDSMYDIRFYWKNGPNSSLYFNEDFIKTTFS